VNEELAAWLRFANAELSPRAAHALLNRYGTPIEVFQASQEELAGVPELVPDQVVRLTDPSRAPTDKQIENFERLNVRLVSSTDLDYPPLLREVADRPAYLFVRGTIDERDRFAVAVVGTRRPTPYGREIASTFSRDLAEMGFTIISGGAMGIDAAAHHGALRAGGRTIIVLGCGIDVAYPALNQPIFNEIVENGQGAVVSEYPMGATPESWRFPVRNRIISGMAMAVVVVEAGRQSGALITAGTAADQGRDVMAVPGNVDRPSSVGTNSLIMDGASLVTCAQDIVNQLGVTVLPKTSDERSASTVTDLPDDQRRILTNLSLTPKHIDVLSADVGMSTAQTSALLTLLELQGLVHRQPGGTYIRAL